MTDVAEWDALISEALEIEETAEDRERRLRHLERDILTAGLPPKDTADLVARLYAAQHAEGMHD
jgi:hypothetical protein